jgi:hypothetical protein
VTRTGRFNKHLTNALRPRLKGTAMQTEFMLLAIYNKPRLNLQEVCSAIGMSIKTAYNKRLAHISPIPMAGDPLMADIRDVGAHLDVLRNRH